MKMLLQQEISMKSFNLDKSVSVKTFTSASSNSLGNLIDKNNLCDVWRYKHPGEMEFSRRQFVDGILKQSRIDLILVSRNLLCFISKAFIKYSSISDHDLECMLIDLHVLNVVKGYGFLIMPYWKMFNLQRKSVLLSMTI